MVLIEDKLNLPLDIVRYINKFLNKPLNDETIRTAVKLWFSDQEECIKIYGHISEWNVFNVTDMKQLFKHQSNFNEDISRWNTSNVVNMSLMFYYCYNFNQYLNN